MLTPAQLDIVGRVVEGVKQKQAAAADRQRQAVAGAQDRQHQMALTQAKGSGQALLGKPKAGSKSNSTSSSKPKSAAAAQSQITPYLTATDMMNVSDRTAAAENTDADARFGYARAAADALQASGNIERSRVEGVSSANDDAAARGLYDSGIRAGNVGKANTAAARGQSQVQGALGLAGVQAVAQRQAARNQLNDFLSATAAKAAENGAALPVDPYAQSPGQGSNVKGAATRKKAVAR